LRLLDGTEDKNAQVGRNEQTMSRDKRRSGVHTGVLTGKSHLLRKRQEIAKPRKSRPSHVKARPNEGKKMRVHRVKQNQPLWCWKGKKKKKGNWTGGSGVEDLC